MFWKRTPAHAPSATPHRWRIRAYSEDDLYELEVNGSPYGDAEWDMQRPIVEAMVDGVRRAGIRCDYELVSEDVSRR